MSEREKIFGDIHKALEPLNERTPYPDWDDNFVVAENLPQGLSQVALFQNRLERVHGRYIDGIQNIATFLKEEKATKGYVDPGLMDALAPHFDGIECVTEIDRARIDDLQFGITRAAGAVAESGSIILKDRITSARLGALAPWIHIAIVREQDIFPDVPTAIADFDDDPSIIFATGPSKTADIEGILIEGVHGPGIQAACVVKG